MNAGPTHAPEHEDVFALLPWLINGTLTTIEQQRVERHLLDCDDCRREVQQQRRLHDAMHRETSNLDYAPQPAFDRLWSRIEELEREVPTVTHAVNGEQPEPAPVGPVLVGPATGVATPARRWLLAASVLLAFAAGLFASWQWRATPSSPPAEFQTATTTTADLGHGPRLRAVFAPATTVEELTRMVRATRLTIVAGPTDSGVYTLALDPSSGGTIDDALVRLRNDPRVRFAEPMLVDGGLD